MNESLKYKISFAHLALFLILLPFDRIYSELILISLFIHTLIHTDRKSWRKVIDLKVLICASVFFITLLGLIWTRDGKEGLADLQKQLAVILFAVIFAVTQFDKPDSRKKLLVAFGFICVLVILYLYIDAFRIILYNKLPLKSIFSQAFINHNFSAPIGLHATYFSMFCGLCFLAYFFCFLFEKEKKKSIFYFICLLILSAGLIQLASRSALLGLLASVIISMFFLPKKTPRKQFILLMFAAILASFFAITRIDSFRKRYISEFKNDLTQADVNNDILEPRIIRWKQALAVIKGSVIIGHGSGSEQRLLNNVYFENKLYNSYLNRLNAHNQYLSFLIETGLTGLLIFLFTLFSGFYFALKKRDPLFMGFITIISVVSFSENILDVNKGIFFYAFFLPFFMIGSKPFLSKLRFE